MRLGESSDAALGETQLEFSDSFPRLLASEHAECRLGHFPRSGCIRVDAIREKLRSRLQRGVHVDHAETHALGKLVNLRDLLLDTHLGDPEIPFTGNRAGAHT